MVLFPNEEIELWEYSENETETDWWGETKPSYQYVGTYTCDFQNMSPKDTEEEYGKILEDAYKIYLPLDTPITDTMLIRKVGEPHTYSIKGSPSKYNHILPHIKVLVQRQRKPTQLE